MPTDLVTPAAIELVAALRKHGQTLAAAESLTAGLFAATIASVPGASEVLRGGLVVYTPEAKIEQAGVQASSITDYGVVSAQVAEELAVGARARFTSDWAVGFTGVAGPGPSDGIAAGTVYVGIAGPRAAETRALALSGDRWAVRLGAVNVAISELLGRVNAVRNT